MATAGLGRQQMAVGLQGTCALLRSFEAIRRIQQDAAHHALERHQAVLNTLGNGQADADLATLQARLLIDNLQEAYAYWQQLFSVGWTMQRELLQDCMGGADSQSDEPSPLAQAMAPVFDLYTNGTAVGRARTA